MLKKKTGEDFEFYYHQGKWTFSSSKMEDKPFQIEVKELVGDQEQFAPVMASPTPNCVPSGVVPYQVVECKVPLFKDDKGVGIFSVAYNLEADGSKVMIEAESERTLTLHATFDLFA